MNVIRDRLTTRLNADEHGMTIVEVLVAMIIFALISTGVVYSMLSMLSVSRDTRARQVATQLAAEEIDRARAVDDVTALVGWSTASGDSDPNDANRPAGPVVLNGDTFHIERTVEWVSDPASELNCGASEDGALLHYKRVNVRITWDNMRGAGRAVQADSAITPHNRINDPTKGTVLVTVLKADGTGASGVRVSASPFPGAAYTDASGCAYLMEVDPGDYSLSVEKTGYVDDQHVAIPIKPISVVAGRSAAAAFQYDQQGTLRLEYPAGAHPLNSPMSLINPTSVHVVPVPGSLRVNLHPSNYHVIAGDIADCLGANPASWEDGPSLDPEADPSIELVAPDLPPYAVVSGQTVVAQVPVGVVEADLNPNRYILAESVDGVQPACTEPVFLRFPVNEERILLPYGSWRLTNVNPGGVAFDIDENRITLHTTGVVENNVVTLDPRVPGVAE